jgi:hypothetical protein
MRVSPPYLRTTVLIGLMSCPFLCFGEEIDSAELAYFETHVRPNLIKYCYECHSVESGESRGGLYLDTRQGMREGGSTGPLFDGAYPLFIDAITWADPDLEMPPKKKMSDDVIAIFKKWAKMGAPDPRTRVQELVRSEIDIEAGKNHWSYQQPQRPAATSIDELIVAKRQGMAVESVGTAGALSLLRRLSFDLTGLPPTPSEVKTFYAAFRYDRQKAVTAKVDELLASDQYGERWGRHWMDVVRYGESSGTLNIVYPYAWRFRNYVIDSFNDDKPYDRLLTEHLAGDLLSAANDEERQELLIATGFLAIGPKKQNEKNRQVFAMNLIDEQIDTTTRGFLATTVACARCHDHKFDPIPTADYYAMAGIFKSTETLWGTVAGNQNHRSSELMPLPIADKGLSSENQASEYQEQKKRLDELIQKNNTLRGRDDRGKGKGGRARGSDEQTKMLESMGMERRDLVRLKQQILRLQSELKFLNPDGSAKTFGMGAREASVTNCNILLSGDINKPAQEVERGFPQVLGFAGMPEIPADASGRLELAQWIGSPNNPLTARVMVNRIWSQLIGAPIVETMDNFGTTGLPPSNPELLDFLAIRFMESGWSIKTMIREIVLSDSYQLASTYHHENYAKDPANTTNWRANPRQLDAEALRDQMLLISGQLDLTRPESSMAYAAGDSRISERRGAPNAFNTALFKGRSLYLPILRDALPDELGLFDFPDPQGTVGKRSITNVAPQSLHLMNSELVLRQAQAMADVLTQKYPELQQQVSNAFLISYGRPATSEEVARGLQFVSEFTPGSPAVAKAASSAPVEQTRRKGKAGRRRGAAPTQATSSAASEAALPIGKLKLAAFCQALMMSAEFRIVH